jgi:Zn-finger nucleic acid-binding protein
MIESEDDRGTCIDVCIGCGAIWLDAGELELKGGKLPPGGVEYKGDRRCPRCDVAMLVRPSRVVELDVCPKCRGIFLDPGELDFLRDACRLSPAGQSPGPSSGSDESVVPRFACDECHQEFSLDEQVLGERLTVCKGCAARLGVLHDPAARRRAECARSEALAPERPVGAVSTLDVLSVGVNVLDLVFWLLR